MTGMAASFPGAHTLETHSEVLGEATTESNFLYSIVDFNLESLNVIEAKFCINQTSFQIRPPHQNAHLKPGLQARLTEL